MRLQFNKKIIKSELLFIFYIFMFLLIRPLLIEQNEPNIILSVVTLFIISISLLTSRLKKKNVVIFFIVITFIFIIVLFDMIFRPNSLQITVPYNFIIYGIIPLFLMINIKDFKALLKYYCFFSIIIGVIYFIDPFYNYNWSSDYMQFGILIMLPAVAGSIIGYITFRKKIFNLFIIIFMIELLIFGNKGAFLTSVIFYLIMYVTNIKKNSLNIKIIFFITFILIIALNIESIVAFIDSYLKKIGVYSYSITTLNNILFRYSYNNYTRLYIWEKAWYIFKEAPILGHGTVYLEGINNSSSGYAHNIVLDLAVSYGVCGIFLFVSIIYRVIKNISKCKNEYVRDTFILFSTLSLIPLFFSLTFWKSTEFRILIGMIVYSYKNK